MSEFQYEQPTEAPTSQSSAPYTKYLQYKSGKTPAGFAKAATPDQVNAGFSFYDKEAKQSVKVENFTACVVAVLSGVSGTVKDGDYYNRYYSNLIFDTRTDLLSVRMFGIDKVQFSGKYADFKNALPQGVGYTLFFVAYIPELKEVVAIELTTGLQSAIVRAIAEQTGAQQSKIKLFNLNDLSTKFWCFRFSGEFEKRDNKGNDWSGTGEMYFMPKIQVLTLTTQKAAQQVEFLSGIADEVRDYVSTIQGKLRGATTQQEPTMHEDHAFPTDEPPQQQDGDDLPF